ncbi:BCS1 N terminal-domain-containing protein [Cladorrhinum samala]|uniref:BCS1 N terminal-domain-containing protein n=1 Tax=Cladorrhinum samala TaxID=585594 RepID=A0AAV9H8Z2_9PEZI|nr:BCS1 N terminal-domain-containing protein [Cladorrhinum samala]
MPNISLLDMIFPGFSVFFTVIEKYVGVDLNFYMPMLIFLGGLTVAWRYFSEYFHAQIEAHLMSQVDIRTDDEIYNILMAWVAEQKFSSSARRFVANTNLNSRALWWLWFRDNEEEEEEEETGEDGSAASKQKKKALAYTPTFGSHWFFYRRRLLIFRRQPPQGVMRLGYANDKEEISIQCFGRNPWILKELINEARESYLKRDEHKTLIYRGALRGQNQEPSWQRCMSRNSRPFSTVILNEKVKKELIDDVTDYLNPATRRWYANRGIPYRRGYLLYGPPGTGKSSLSLALAGFFNMRIYIVSLSSITANEENLASLFNELPRRCVVLLEDIDTAGLTHTREEAAAAAANASSGSSPPASSTPPTTTTGNLPSVGRLSLSGLLNILDGVASQEGRVLIMTTNHIEKLDKALIRPGRVDMVVKFDRADPGMTAAIFRAIYAPLEGDKPLLATAKTQEPASASTLTPEEAEKQKQSILAKIDRLAEEFASKIPSLEFSPAEIQGFLLKNKRSPEKAVEGADEWIVEARKEKKVKEEEDKKKKIEEEDKARKLEEENKAKAEEEEKEKKKESKEKEKKSKRSKRSSRRKVVESSSEYDSEDDSSSESDVDGEVTEEKKEEEVETGVAAVKVEAPVGITVDTKKANEVSEAKGVKTGPDSGYGTPGGSGTP